MRFNHYVLLFSFQLMFLESVFLFCGNAFSQEISQGDVQRKVITEETKQRIEDLLKKGFEHRDQIKSGQMKIEYHSLVFGSKGDLHNEQTMKMTLTFDRERMRVEQRDIQSNNPYSGGKPHIAVGCVGCYNGDNRLIVHYSQYEDDKQYGLSVYDTSLQFKGQEATSLWTEHLNLVPQYVVYCSTNRFPTKKTIEQAQHLLFVNTVGNFNVPGILESGILDVDITKEDYKGVLCSKITFVSNFTDGEVLQISLWIAEEQGYALRKHHLQDSMYDELMEVDVALDKDSGIWFPSAWHYERNNHYEGNNTRYTENGTVTDVVLNKPIPEKIFTMEDIKMIPAGVSVSWNTEVIPPPHGANRTGDLLWDGHEIITRGMRAERLVEQARTESKSKKRQFIILANVAVISMILAVFLWRYYTRLRQKN